MACSGTLSIIVTALACLFLLTGFAALTQYVRLIFSGKTFQPWNTHKGLHVIIGIGSIARGILFVITLTLWDQEAGSLSTHNSTAQRMVFYFLDQMASLMAFSSELLLAVFWAELYYIATSRAGFYRRIIHPIFITINVLVLSGALIIWILYGTTWNHFDLYIYWPYSLYIGMLYMMAVGLLASFGRHAFLELTLVPIEIPLRRQKLQEITTVTGICGTTLFMKALAILYIADRALVFKTLSQQFLVLAYFFALEWLPSVVILYFNRRRPDSRKNTFGEEARMLLDRPGQRLDVEASIRYLSNRDFAYIED